MTGTTLEQALAESELAYLHHEISDGTARALAAACSSRAAAVRDFLATGAVPAETSPLYREITESAALGAVAMSMLGTYLVAHAGRGPVPGWETA
jgi:hypothetical protein